MANTRSFPDGARYYSSTINEGKAQPAFNFLYDPSIVYTTPAGISHTGGWRASRPSDYAAEINVSGGLQVDLGPLNITGIVQTVSVISNTAPIPVSGVTYVSNFPSSWNVHETGNANVTITNFPSYFNTHETGTANVSIINGTVNVSATGVSNVSGLVTAQYPSSTSVSTSTPASVYGLSLAANTARKSWFVQNLATGALYIKFGTAATNSSFNVVLKGQTNSDSFDGASWTDEGARYKGNVSTTGIGPANFIIWEMA